MSVSKVVIVSVLLPSWSLVSTLWTEDTWSISLTRCSDFKLSPIQVSTGVVALLAQLLAELLSTFISSRIPTGGACSFSQMSSTER